MARSSRIVDTVADAVTRAEIAIVRTGRKAVAAVNRKVAGSRKKTTRKTAKKAAKRAVKKTAKKTVSGAKRTYRKAAKKSAKRRVRR